MQKGTALDKDNCTLGDFYHDNDARLFGVCVSPKNLDPYEYINTRGIFCKYLCPEPSDGGNSGGGCSSTFTAESNFRVWSNASMWPGEVLPKDGDTVTILK